MLTNLPGFKKAFQRLKVDPVVFNKLVRFSASFYNPPSVHVRLIKKLLHMVMFSTGGGKSAYKTDVGLELNILCRSIVKVFITNEYVDVFNMI